MYYGNVCVAVGNYLNTRKLVTFVDVYVIFAVACRLLGTFQSTLDEITIIAQPEQEPQHSTAAAAAAARRSVQIKSFYDPAKGMCSVFGWVGRVQAAVTGEAHSANTASQSPPVCANDISADVCEYAAEV